jgi:hypothetical protein
VPWTSALAWPWRAPRPAGLAGPVRGPRNRPGRCGPGRRRRRRPAGAGPSPAAVEPTGGAWSARRRRGRPRRPGAGASGPPAGPQPPQHQDPLGPGPDSQPGQVPAVQVPAVQVLAVQGIHRRVSLASRSGRHLAEVNRCSIPWPHAINPPPEHKHQPENVDSFLGWPPSPTSSSRPGALMFTATQRTTVPRTRSALPPDLHPVPGECMGPEHPIHRARECSGPPTPACRCATAACGGPRRCCAGSRGRRASS